MTQKRIVMFAGKRESSAILYNALCLEHEIECVIMEEPISRKVFLKRRVEKLGLLKTAGQILFQTMVQPLLRIRSTKRLAEISNEFSFDATPIPEEKIRHVPSINSQEAIALIADLRPDIVVVHGTRIISKSVLNVCTGRIINAHAGITPLFRGVHGAYWALVKNQPHNCGVTVHLVDPGIDTGGILLQEEIKPKPNDNFVTYQSLQLALAIELFRKVISQLIAGEIELKQPRSGESALWSHPTIWEYLWYKYSRGVV